MWKLLYIGASVQGEECGDWAGIPTDLYDFYDEMRESAAEMMKRLTKWEGKSEEMMKRISVLEEKNSVLEGQVSALTGGGRGAKGNSVVESLGTETMAPILTRLTNLESMNKDMSQTMKSCQAELAHLTSLKSTIGAGSPALNAITTRLGDMENKLEDITAAVETTAANLRSTNEMLMTEMKKDKERFMDLESKIQKNNGAIDSVQSSLTYVSRFVDHLEKLNKLERTQKQKKFANVPIVLSGSEWPLGGGESKLLEDNRIVFVLPGNDGDQILRGPSIRFPRHAGRDKLLLEWSCRIVYNLPEGETRDAYRHLVPHLFVWSFSQTGQFLGSPVFSLRGSEGYTVLEKIYRKDGLLELVLDKNITGIAVGGMAFDRSLLVINTGFPYSGDIIGYTQPYSLKSSEGAYSHFEGNRLFLNYQKYNEVQQRLVDGVMLGESSVRLASTGLALLDLDEKQPDSDRISGSRTIVAPRPPTVARPPHDEVFLHPSTAYFHVAFFMPSNKLMLELNVEEVTITESTKPYKPYYGR